MKCDCWIVCDCDCFVLIRFVDFGVRVKRDVDCLVVFVVLNRDARHSCF